MVFITKKLVMPLDGTVVKKCVSEGKHLLKFTTISGVSYTHYGCIEDIDKDYKAVISCLSFRNPMCQSTSYIRSLNGQ